MILVILGVLCETFNLAFYYGEKNSSFMFYLVEFNSHEKYAFMNKVNSRWARMMVIYEVWSLINTFFSLLLKESCRIFE